MAPFTATIRRCAPIEPLASTTKRIRLPVLVSRTFSRMSHGSTKSTLFEGSADARRRSRWWGAAARSVASSAKSVTFSRGGCAPT